MKKYLVISGVVCMLASVVYAAGTKISNLPAASSVGSSDMTLLVQGGVNKNAPVSMLAQGLNATDLLNKIKTVDGTGSGLDADLFQGRQASTFQNSSTAINRHNIGTQSVASAVNSITVGGLFPGNAIGKVAINNGTLNTSLNAQFLNGYSASAFLSSGTVVRGSVNADGTVNQGAGLFTATHTGTGTYTVTFATPFPSVPVIVMSSGNPTAVGDGHGEVALVSSNAGGFSMSYDVHGTSDIMVDTSFSFIAIQ